MDKDLRSYLKVYDKIPASMCEEIVSGLEEVYWSKHFYSNTKTAEEKTLDTDLSITYEDVPHRDELMAIIWGCLKQYMDDVAFSWFHSWNGFSAVRFNRYEEGQQMIRHCDHIHSLFDTPNCGIPTLTVLGGLNKDYEGGDLVFWENEKIELPAGSIMVFPSNFLYPHEVLPVKSGKRYSFVSWAY